MKQFMAVVPILFLNPAFAVRAETPDLPPPAATDTGGPPAATVPLVATGLEWEPLPPPVSSPPLETRIRQPRAPATADASAATPTQANASPTPTATAATAATSREAHAGGVPVASRGVPASVWHADSRAALDAQGLIDAERARDAGRTAGAPAAAQAVGTLSQHAARVMGAGNAAWSGLASVPGAADTAPPIPVVPASPAQPAAGAEVSRDAGPRQAKGAAAPAGGPGGAIEAVMPKRADASGVGRFHAGGASVKPALASSYDTVIEQAARTHDVAPDLVRAVVKVESNFQPRARSAKGAVGLMQLMPATAKRFGAADPTDPSMNIHAGTEYLSKLLTRFDGDLPLALAAYNAGEGAVEKYGRRVPPYPETQNYVTKVLAHFDGASGALEASVAPARGGRTATAAGGAAPPRGVAGWVEAVLTSSGRTARPERVERGDRYRVDPDVHPDALRLAIATGEAVARVYVAGQWRRMDAPSGVAR